VAKKKAHPLDNLTFGAQKLDEIESVAPPPAPTPKVETRASNVTLPVPAWEWIDAKHAEARSKGGHPLRKSAIIRAVFDVAMSVDVDLSGSQSEEEIVQRLLHAIRQKDS